ncbi:MAG TPA: carboxypeptidase-like regulatory domain-containing protein [Bacteroidia bacterium]|nr:carboxypeptidase-like regulatory domain-containing protein [Bacteroidia bacterium]
MKKVFVIVLFFLMSQHLCCQTVFSGILLDSLAKTPVEFANIGIVGKGFGTVTNDKGEFSLTVPDSLLNESIRVSMLGYKPKVYKAAAARAGITIFLVEDVNTLNEVVVQVKKTKIKMLGNDTKTRHVLGGFKKNSLGSELAIRLNIKNPQTQLRRFLVNINANSLGMPVFRFNLYNVDDKGMPKENILKQNIIIEPKQKTGLIELDLLPYNIYVDDDVFISIEWIKDLGDVKGLSFSTKLVGSTTYYRLASQDQWRKISPVGVGLHAEVGY